MTMPILKPPQRPSKNETLQVRVEEEIKSKVHRYAEFISSSESYVVSEALKLLFRKDDEFKEWLREGEQRQGNGAPTEIDADDGTKAKPFDREKTPTARPQVNS
jgi:predicted transcriptional regulator